MISLSHYLVLAAILFAIAVIGIFLNRKNVIDPEAPEPAYLEAAIGLAILVVLFRNISSIHVEDLGKLKG